MSVNVAYKIRNFFVYTFLAIVMLIVLYPFVYVLTAAFADGNTMTTLSCAPFGNGFSMSNFANLFTKTEFPRWFANTLLIALLSMAGSLVVCVLGAYIFSRYSFPGKKKMILVIFVLQIVPSFISMIAMYYVLYRIGALDTKWGLALVYIAGNIPYNIWLVKTYMDSIPVNMEEAAKMEGASGFTIFTKLVLPAVRPITVFLAITSFTAPWVDFIFPKLLLRSRENKTVALGLYSLYNEQGDFGTFCAGAIFVIIPFILFFLATQNMLTESMSTSLDEDL